MESGVRERHTLVEGIPPMPITLCEIAELIQGNLQGDGSLPISGAAILRDAQPGDITLADNPRFAPQLLNCRASAAIVGRDFEPRNIPFICVDDVHRSFAKIVSHLQRQVSEHPSGIDLTAQVDSSASIAHTALIGPRAKIGPRVIVGENCEIGADSVLHGGVHLMANCRLGEGCELFPNVVLYENSQLADRVILHAAVVIGAYGFGYETKGGRHVRSAQLGNVVIEADVEIGAGTTIDRGTYGPTRIGEGTKIDNQVMIAHNCRIGKHNLICSHVGIAGSASTGDHVTLAGQVGLRDHVHVGDRAVICAQAGVMNEVPPGAMLVGSPAIAEREQLLVWAASYKLPELRKQFKALQKIVEQLHGPHPDLNSGDSGIQSREATPLKKYKEAS